MKMLALMQMRASLSEGVSKSYAFVSSLVSAAVNLN